MKMIHEKTEKTLNDFINKILFFDKKKVFDFEGIRLYTSEIHLMLVMSRKPTNATQMAAILNVTKGAVSQTIKRLEKKGVIQKTKDPYSKNELTLTFTPLGERMLVRYKQLSDSLNTKFRENISTYDDRELEVIEGFLSRMVHVFEDEI